MKISFYTLLLTVITACSTGAPPRQNARSLVDTKSVRLVAPERPAVVDTVFEPPLAEEPRSVYRPPKQNPRSRRSHDYYLGPRGGCYTYTSSGRKRYVDRSFCR